MVIINISKGETLSRRPRIFLDCQLNDQDVVELPQSERRHLMKVLRAQPESSVEVFNEQGYVANAKILEDHQLRIESPRFLPNVPDLKLNLMIAGIRAERLEWLIQKGTELGVHSFTIWQSKRTERLHHRKERLQKVMVEACKQSSRNQLPVVRGPTKALPTLSEGTMLGWVCSTEATVPLTEALQGQKPKSLTLLIGPEGGLTPDELQQLRATDWHVFGLGPRILKAETAAIVGASLILSEWGDWA